MTRLTLFGLALALIPGAASANPIATEVLRIRQVPGTLHVQITYGYDADAGGAPGEPSKTTRDGEGVALEWTEMDGRYTANTGSGLAGVDATQACDCDVVVGTHRYEVTVGSDRVMMATVTVSQPGATYPMETDTYDQADAGDEDVEVYPWEIPEPTEIQGLDCAVACAGAGAEVAEELPVAEPEQDAGPTSQGDASDSGTAGTGVDVDDDSCAASPGTTPWALLAALAALALLALRRRERA